MCFSLGRSNMLHATAATSTQSDYALSQCYWQNSSHEIPILSVFGLLISQTSQQITPNVLKLPQTSPQNPNFHQKSPPKTHSFSCFGWRTSVSKWRKTRPQLKNFRMRRSPFGTSKPSQGGWMDDGWGAFLGGGGGHKRRGYIFFNKKQNKRIYTKKIKLYVKVNVGRPCWWWWFYQVDSLNPIDLWCRRTKVWEACFLGGGNSNIFYFHPYLGKWSNLTSIFFKWVETTN